MKTNVGKSIWMVLGCRVQSSFMKIFNENLRLENYKN